MAKSVTGTFAWQRLLPILILLVSCTTAVHGVSPRPPFTVYPTANGLTMDNGLQALQVSMKSPRITFEGSGAVGDTLAIAISPDLPFAPHVEASFTPIDLGSGEQLKVTVFVEWASDESVVRKWARLELAAAQPRLITEIVLEDLALGDRPAAIKAGDAQSQPIILKGAFMGIEFPIAASRVEEGRAILAYRPGLLLQPGTPYETHKAVYGLAQAGAERQAFQRYIAYNRPSKDRMHANYNSWWTSPVPYTEADILGIMAKFEENLYKKNGASFDTFCIDMGWSNKHSLWEIDPKLFPGGFTKIQEAAKNANGQLGLWISPSSCYPDALDNNWAAEQGYESFMKPWVNNQPARLLCLGGKRYQEAFQRRLVELATNAGVRHFKLDGYILECPESGHGHAPGPLSSDAIARGFIAAVTTVRQAAPDVWLEPTCFGYNPSPWWLFHCDSVIGSYGDDAPYGRVPCPTYRESYTTARDYFNLQGAYWSPVPIAAQEVLGVIHQTKEPFLNDAVMTVLRGHMFLPLYVNPAYMDDDRYTELADLLSWARENVALLGETQPLLPVSWADGKCPVFAIDATMPRDPYGYMHVKDGRGLIALRNPWIAPQTYSLKLAGLNAASVVSIYPEARVYGRDLATDATLDVPLAPYETVVLSVGPEAVQTDLPTVAEALNHPIAVKVARQQFTQLEFDGPTDSFGPDFTRLFADVSKGVHARLEAEVEASTAQSELLILIEDKPLPASLRCTVKIDGQEAALEQSSSDFGWAATGQPRPENWIFFTTPLPSAKHAIDIDVIGGSPTARISAWVLATKKGADGKGALPAPDSLTLNAVALLDSKAPPTEVERMPRPAETIDGVYLDAIEPQSATTGYGTVQKNRSVWEKPMTIGGKSFRRGLGTHAPATIVYALDGTYAYFQAHVGADG
ncbi:MAG: NPCBM/NEW2 domain-containing protein, partial [FCB group bacterium]|nr:NPCBM/NEW2 domain-containing protein [FCB group bacterium]